MIGAVDYSPFGALFHEDRVAFVNHLASALSSSDLSIDIAVHLRSIMADEELQTFHASIRSIGVYTEWVAKYSIRSTQSVKAAIRSLDKFVLAHPDMAGSSQVASVRARLLEMQEEGIGH